MAMSDQLDEQLLRPEEAAAVIGFHPSELTDLIAVAGLPAIRLAPRTYRFRRSELLEWEARSVAFRRPVPQQGGVYAIRGAGNFVKIGRAKNIAHRIRNLQVSHPVPLKLLAILSSDPKDEAVIRARFKAFRVHGEWFRLTGALRAFIAEKATR